MTTSIQHIPAAEVLAVATAAACKLGVEFLDLSVRYDAASAARHCDPDALRGCGLYALCFEGTLLYVGKYLGSRRAGHRNQASFDGNVAAQRWWAHVASFTARGRRLHVSRSALTHLVDSCGRAHPLAQGLSAAGDGIYSDAGCLGTGPRLAFAAAHWEDFSVRDARNLLAGFEFIYVRVLPEAVDPTRLATAINRAEAELIHSLRPQGNGGPKPQTLPSSLLTPARAAQRLAATLEHELAGA